jgi:hypothetical protein
MLNRPLAVGFPRPVKIIRSALIGKYRRWSALVGVYRRGEIPKNGPVLDSGHENKNIPTSESNSSLG